jgi:hypothetical protein
MFKKGQSGNPKGRVKKEFTIKGALEAAGLTDKVIAKKLYAGFLADDPVFGKMAVEYGWGKPIVKTENHTEITFPEKIEVVLKAVSKG